MTLVAFTFHICLFAVPIFLSAHILLFRESWNISWWWMPDPVSDIMTWMCDRLLSFFHAGRRLMLRDVRYL